MGLTGSGSPARLAKAFAFAKRKGGIAGIALDQVEGRDGSRDDRRRKAGGIDHGARTVANEVHDRGGGADITAIGTERLRQRSHLQRDIGLDRLHEIRTATPADHAQAVRIVGQEPGVMALRQCCKRMQGRDIAVHGKDPIGGDHGVPVTPAQLREQHLDMPDISMAKRDHGSA